MKQVIQMSLLLLAVCSGCSTQVHVDGTIQHKVVLDASALDSYFTALCKQELATNMGQCVAAKTAQFLEFVAGVK